MGIWSLQWVSKKKSEKQQLKIDRYNIDRISFDAWKDQVQKEPLKNLDWNQVFVRKSRSGVLGHSCQ